MSFGKQLKQLAFSVDDIDNSQLKKISEVIQKYTQQVLNIERTQLFLATEIDGVPALERRDLLGFTRQISEQVKDSKGNYRSQVALAYARKKPVWIVGNKGPQRLDVAERYVDDWSRLRKIPRFRPRQDSASLDNTPVLTSISIPIRRRRSNRVFGVINFQTSHYLRPTEEAKAELHRVADAVAILLTVQQDRETRARGTDQAIGILDRRVDEPLPSLIRPTVFVASSGRADAEVITAIEEVLNTYHSRLGYIHWRQMNKPGNIVNQLWTVMGSCRYGICYLSEPASNGDGFIDNRNVIFEAGMFHGRTAFLDGGQATHWIPIREPQSPDIFFDIAQERLLLVDRYQNGGLDKHAFVRQLNTRIDAFFDVAEV